MILHGRRATTLADVLLLGALTATLLSCGGVPERQAAPEAATHIVPEISGEVENLEQEVSVLQKQVATQEHFYDLSRNQLKDREAQYGKQTDLFKGFVFFLAGLCIVMFLAPAPRSRWSGALMVGTLALTLIVLGAWLFRL